jgi:hypothetical protein
MTFGLFTLLTYGVKWVTSRKVVDLFFYFYLLARNVEDIETMEFGVQLGMAISTRSDPIRPDPSRPARVFPAP